MTGPDLERPEPAHAAWTGRFSRRQWLAAAGAGVVAAAGYSRFVEPALSLVSHHVIGTTTDVPPYRIVQLSDLHLHRIGWHERRIAGQVSALDPALVVFTGDVIDDASSLHLADEFLRLLPSRPQKLAILGNWEYWGRVEVPKLRSIYEKHDTLMLVNASVTVAHRGRTLVISGLDDFVAGHPDLVRAMEGTTATPNMLLLQHCPGFRDDLSVEHTGVKPTFLLSGHTHGGQIAPFGWAPMRPPGSGRYVRGWYQDAHGALPPMYVSRGIGTSIVPMRFCSPPEIAVFDWHLSAE